ncbi:SMP-30/gluconolactonase/LRE family protein [Mucilaginibacter sp. UR6-1]|uniref:SMP-30/gluconolactonase/LRE family protein n=1 Tax=Mucilaginibacter sp. UR6-1 TaxID=1435643 RepID=UPI001E45E42F|nr:SMP-30/gluconolactonase/LRE family protein [Mucilaginibacter sp. UR6-1]MCC8407982.1 SMP-30/gluconolactonase/LRE family protein [Mucilaginibacter sp. UR6-1]
MKKLILLIVAMAFGGPLITKAQQKPLYDTTQKPTLVSRQFEFTEGPATDKNGDVYFTDQPNDKIWKYSADGKLTVFMDKTGRSNGLFFDNKGCLLACADEKNELWVIDKKGGHEVLLSNFNGKRFNGPNDGWVLPNGDMYFTDPYYQRDYWQHKSSELDGEKLYYLKKGSKQAVVANDQFKQPNGIVGTADGKYLYVADIGDNKTYRFNIGKNGSLTNRVLIIKQGSDGMTLDDKGNIYLTGKGVTIYNPQGEKLFNIPVPEQWTGNVTFAGKNRDVLFITASKGIYTLKMNVKGK